MAEQPVAVTAATSSDIMRAALSAIREINFRTYNFEHAEIANDMQEIAGKALRQVHELEAAEVNLRG